MQCAPNTYTVHSMHVQSILLLLPPLMSQARLFDPRFGFGWSGQTKKEREKKPCVRYLLSVTLSDLGMNTNLRNNLSGQEGKKKKKNSKIKHDDYKTRTYL